MSLTDTNYVDNPPICDCCGRKVKSTGSRPFLLGADDMLCKDCWIQWYDPDWSTGGTREGIKANVLRKHGEFGGEANLLDIYAARLERAANCLGEHI